MDYKQAVYDAAKKLMNAEAELEKARAEVQRCKAAFDDLAPGNASAAALSSDEAGAAGGLNWSLRKFFRENKDHQFTSSQILEELPGWDKASVLSSLAKFVKRGLIERPGGQRGLYQFKKEVK